MNTALSATWNPTLLTSTAPTAATRPANEEEAALVARILNGEREAYGVLVERHSRSVYNLAYRMLGNVEDAEDAAQEALLRAYERLDRYEPTHPFRTWLLTITTRLCIDRLRRKGPSLAVDGEAALLTLAGPEDPSAPVLARERRRELQGVLMRLPGVYRAVLILRYWHDLSCEEIAQVVGASVGAVKTRLYRARQALLLEFGGQTVDLH